LESNSRKPTSPTHSKENSRRIASRSVRNLFSEALTLHERRGKDVKWRFDYPDYLHHAGHTFSHQQPQEKVKGGKGMDRAFKETVDELLGITTPVEDFKKAEHYARRKLQMAKERDPNATYYNDHYLALLTADVYREMMFSRYTMELYVKQLNRTIGRGQEND